MSKKPCPICMYVPLGLKSWFAEKSIPIHWGTFQLTHEPFLEPPKLLAKAMELERLPQNQFGALKIGETLIVKKIGAPKD